MNGVEVIKGFYLVPRTNHTGQRPKTIEIQVSTDNVNYQTLTDADLMSGYTFQMANNPQRKEFRLASAMEVRYVKIVFRSTNHNGNGEHSVSEFGAFFDND